MKLVDTSIINNAEGIFYKAMISAMDLATIEALFRKHYNLNLSGEAEFQNLKIVAHNSQIAFKFDYTAFAIFSIYMDRSGEFVDMENTAQKPAAKIKPTDSANSLMNANLIQKNEIQLAEAIAGKIEVETLSRLIEVKNHAKLNSRLDFKQASLAVHQNQPVYKLVYQGKFVLSFLVDEKGNIIDFAEPQINSNRPENESKLINTKDDTKIDDLIVADDQPEVEIQELSDEVELDLLSDEELQGIEELLGGFDDLDSKIASN